MIPKVLVSNPETNAQTQGLIPTTWDEQSFWMDEGFSFSQSFASTNPEELSPFLLLEARSAFLISLLDTQRDTYLAGVSPLSSLLLFLRSSKQIVSTLAFDKYLKEYSHRSLPQGDPEIFSQMVIWDQDPAQALKKFSLHGRLFLASTVALPQAPEGFCVEQKWSYGEDSEIGLFYLLQLIR